MNNIEEFVNKFHLEEPDKFNILKQIPDNSVDLIVTSPPYNVDIKYDVCIDKKMWKDYWEWNREWLTECFRVLKDDGRICLNHYLALNAGGEKILPIAEYYTIMKDIGYKYNSVALWTDTTISKLTAWVSYLMASAPHINTPYEMVLICYKNNWKKNNKGISTIGKKEFISGVSGSWNFGTDKLRLTDATFPEALPHQCINLLSYKDDIVLDPFSGSGTTCVVAQKLGRKWIGLDISQNYIDIANRRMNAFVTESSLF